jgi:hypothetical protein
VKYNDEKYSFIIAFSVFNTPNANGLFTIFNESKWRPNC